MVVMVSCPNLVFTWLVCAAVTNVTLCMTKIIVLVVPKFDLTVGRNRIAL
jgi:hypothetical protein